MVFIVRHLLLKLFNHNLINQITPGNTVHDTIIGQSETSFLLPSQEHFHS